jgi:hypothetical protein
MFTSDRLPTIEIYLTRHGNSCANILTDEGSEKAKVTTSTVKSVGSTFLDPSKWGKAIADVASATVSAVSHPVETAQTVVDTTRQSATIAKRIITVGNRAPNTPLSDIGILRALHVGKYLNDSSQKLPSNYKLFSSGLRRAIETAFYQYGIFSSPEKKVNVMPGINEVEGTAQKTVTTIGQATVGTTATAQSEFDLNDPWYSNNRMINQLSDTEKNIIQNSKPDSNALLYYILKEMKDEHEKPKSDPLFRSDVQSQPEDVQYMIQHTSLEDKAYNSETNKYTYAVVSHGGYIKDHFFIHLRNIFNVEGLPTRSIFNNEIFKLNLIFNNEDSFRGILSEIKKIQDRGGIPNLENFNSFIKDKCQIRLNEDFIINIQKPTEALKFSNLQDISFYERCCDNVDSYSNTNCGDEKKNQRKISSLSLDNATHINILEFFNNYKTNIKPILSDPIKFRNGQYLIDYIEGIEKPQQDTSQQGGGNKSKNKYLKYANKLALLE